MQNISLPRLSDNIISRITLGLFAVFLCSLCLYVSPSHLVKTWAFIFKHLGYMSYILIPMTILLFSILIHALIEPLEEGSIWAKIIERLETFFPLVGIVSTILAIPLGFDGLTEDVPINFILSIISEICRAAWGTIYGVAGTMIAHVIRKDLTIAPAAEEPETVAYTPLYSLSEGPLTYDQAIPDENYTYGGISPIAMAVQ